MEKNEGFTEKKQELLYKAIEDNQNSIRFTDTKAGAIFVLCGIVFAFLATLLNDIIIFHKKLINFIPNNNFDVLFQGFLVLIFLVAIVCLYLSIRLSVKAISPKSGPVGSIKLDTDSKVPNVFYISNIIPTPSLINLFRDKESAFSLERKFSEINSDISDLNEDGLKNLLIVELQKLSFIRELKIQRVRQAIKFFLWGVDLLLIKALIIFLITVYY